jgi:carbon-monoxide dehydrogenase large subunit
MSDKAIHHPEFTTGRAMYVGDVTPDAFAASIVRSTVVHGRVLSIDTSAALAIEGVIVVLTAADLAEVPVIPIRSFSSEALERVRQPVLAKDVVRFWGEPLAVVVARDRYVADDAARVVAVEYEVLEPVIHVDDAAEEFATYHAMNGDVDAVFAQAAVVVERQLSTDRHTGLPIEPRGLVASWSDGALDIWGPTKFIDHAVVALGDWFGLARDNVHVRHVAVGGMFGVRGELYPEDFLVPWASRVVGAPVCWIEDRAEHLAAINHAPGMFANVAMAMDAAGRLTGLRASVTLDMGAYPRGNGGRLTMLAIEELTGPYDWDALDITATGVRTNLTPAGSVRAPVAAESTFFRETVVDALSFQAERDTVAVRAASLVAVDRMPFVRDYGSGMHGQLYDGGNFPGILSTLQLDISRLKAATASRRARGDLAAVGVATFLAHSAVSAREQVTVSLDGGRFTVRTSLTEVGQGMDLVLQSVTAEAVGVSPALVSVESGAASPDGAGRGTFSSRSTVVASNALSDACSQLRAWAQIRLDAGAGWEDLGTHQVSGLHDDPEPLLGIGAHVAAVSVDSLTGRVTVDELVVAYDCGFAVDPDGVRGQLLGGAMHGVGIALTEALDFSSAGVPQSSTLLQYRLPIATDVGQISVRIIEGGTSRNPLGAKGAGEAGVIGAPAAIANALAAALHRAEVTRLPIRESHIRNVVTRP